MNDSLDHIREVDNRKTYVVIIGNSDNKLSQKDWSEFVVAVDGAILEWEYERHFAGAPAGHEPFQNYCWIFELEIEEVDGGFGRSDYESLRDELDDLRAHNNQDSILFAELTPSFIQR